jgi:mannosylglycerate hydrolase
VPPLRTIILVSHTHWDREWYLPFEDFRWQLLKMMDQLLDLMDSNPQYSHFNLDGQTILLNDYLELRPKQQSRIKRLVTEGRLQIGPWYVLADEFLVSGESLIRNLLYGHQIANEFGSVMPIGYVPDTFGHIAQLPQILRGFDIDASIFWRGLEDHGKTLPTELRWRAPDGSEVLLVHLRTSYATAANLPSSIDAALAQLLMPMNVLSLRGTSSTILLLNGSDHLPPQPFIPDLLHGLNQRLNTKDLLKGKSVSQLLSEFGKSPTTADITGMAELEPFIDDLFADFIKELQGAQFRQGTFIDYLQIIRDEVDITQLPVIQGEQHSSKFVPVLPGVFSARIYLKQANFTTQQLLERWAEPFATIAYWLGAPYPTNELRRAWQLLLQNHPHDSICGCSVDATHADMERRFAWSQQLGNQILSEAINHINTHIITKPPTSIPQPIIAAFRIFNPHPWPLSDIIRIQLQEAYSIDSSIELVLYDSSGTQVPFQLVNGADLDSSLKSLFEIYKLPTKYSGQPTIPNQNTQHFLTCTASQIPAFGYQTFYLTINSTKNKLPSLPHLTLTQKDNDYHVENSILTLQVSSTNGTLILYHKPTKKRFEKLLTLEDGGDIGDEYNYCAPQNDKLITSNKQSTVKIRVIEKGPVAITLEVQTTLTVPKHVHSSRKRRSSRKTKIPIQHLITVYANQPRVDVQTSLTNAAKDHRLRVLFPTNIHTETAWGDTPFHITERYITPAPQEWESQLYPMMMDFYLTSMLQLPKVPGKPMGWFEDSTTTHALQSFVDVTDGSHGLLIASRGLPEYEVLDDAHHTIALTLLRSIGWLSREDLITRRGHAGPALETPGAQCLGEHVLHYSIIPHQKTWQNPQAHQQAQIFTTPFKAIQIDMINSGHFPATHSFISLEPNNIRFSCLKKAEDADFTILRVYELIGQTSSVSVKTAIPFVEIKQVNFTEQPLKEQKVIAINNHNFSFSIHPYQIQTLHFESKSR